VIENATATICEQDIDYYPYGGVENDYCPNVAQNYKFTGKERDTESGLDNFGARYSASSLGRFMSADAPFADQEAGDPQSWNLYAYVRNNPLSNLDLTGNACVNSDGGTWHDDNSGGETCAEVDAANKKQREDAERANAEPAITKADLNPFNDRPPLVFQGFVNFFLNGNVSKGGIQLIAGLTVAVVLESLSLSAKTISISRESLMHVVDLHSIVVLGKAGERCLHGWNGCCGSCQSCRSCATCSSEWAVCWQIRTCR